MDLVWEPGPTSISLRDHSAEDGPKLMGFVVSHPDAHRAYYWTADGRLVRHSCDTEEEAKAVLLVVIRMGVDHV